MGDTGTISWPGARGKVERPINYTLDVRTHKGEPGMALLLIGANTHLSVTDLGRLLGAFGIKRSRSWIQRRRWMFQQPGTVNSQGRSNADGKDERARELMQDNSRMSARQLVKLLADREIYRSRNWVWMNRCGE